MEGMKTISLYECPRCGRLRFPEGDEPTYGPPECDHGLWFGDGPDGGGECEMVEVEFTRSATEGPHDVG